MGTTRGHTGHDHGREHPPPISAKHLNSTHLHISDDETLLIGKMERDAYQLQQRFLAAIPVVALESKDLGIRLSKTV